MTEDRLREALHWAVPEAPPIEFAPRHRPVLVPVLAAVLVLLVAVPLALLLRRDAAEPKPLVRPGDFACLPAGIKVGASADAVPEGPVAARLCNGGGLGSFPEPADALTSGLEDLVVLLNRMPMNLDDPYCPLNLGRAYRVIFQYADGSMFPVIGHLYGCRDVAVGARRTRTADALWQAFITRLRDQRAANPTQTPGGLVPPACPAHQEDPGASPVALPTELSVARLCVRGKQRQVVREVLLNDAELAVIKRGLVRVAKDKLRCPPAAALPRFTLIGRTARGEVVSLNRGCLALVSSWEELWGLDQEGWELLDRRRGGTGDASPVG